jgi:hypothetical protein
MAGVAFAVEGDGVGFATESYAASAIYTTLANLSGAFWRIRRVRFLNGGSFHKFLSAQVHTSIRGRDDPHLFWCERPVNRALGFPNRLRFDGRLARDHDTGNRSGPFPETALDALNNGIFDVPIFHHQPSF